MAAPEGLEVRRIRPGSLEPILGPLPCLSCGRLVVWATYTAVIDERPFRGPRQSYVRTRAMVGWDDSKPHECPQARSVAA